MLSINICSTHEICYLISSGEIVSKLYNLKNVIWIIVEIIKKMYTLYMSIRKMLKYYQILKLLSTY